MTLKNKLLLIELFGKIYIAFLPFIKDEIQPVRQVKREFSVAADEGGFLGNRLRDNDSVGRVFVVGE